MEATVFVEVPMGSRNKYEVDAASGHGEEPAYTRRHGRARAR